MFTMIRSPIRKVRAHPVVPGCFPARHLSAALLACAAITAPSVAWPGETGAQATPPSIETFFRNPDLRDAKLSPSGKWLAVAAAMREGRVFLAVIDLAEGKRSVKVVAHFPNLDIGSFEWVNDERLVFNTVDLDSTASEQAFGPGLYTVARDGSAQRSLIRARQYFVSGEPARLGTPPLDPNHTLLTVVRDGSDDVIVGKYRVDEDSVRAVIPMRLNVVTGRTTSVASGMPDDVTGWLFDPSGTPKIAERTRRGRTEVFWRAGVDAAWKSIGNFPAQEAKFEPIAVDAAGHLFVTAPNAAGTTDLQRFDFATGMPDGSPIASIKGFDFRGAPVFDPETQRLLGVSYEADARGTAWIDPAMKGLQAAADTRFPGRTNLLTCRGCTGDGVLLVYSFSDQDPGSYWVYRDRTKDWEPIGRSRADVDPARMAQLDLFRIKARDGLEIPVWITKPAGTATAPRPAVVLVHGGPWVRGVHWRWDPDAQFLASRGYVVIEPEFRGSIGYGRTLFERGLRQWGLTMQDDVADAVQWAAARGDIDAKRVCIAGASYGGYATLMGLVRQPELYRCGVAWVAVTDPRLLFEDNWRSDSTDESRNYSLPQLVGDPVKDAAMLKDAAPVEHAAEIRAPLLMAFGRADRRVPLEHGERLDAAMRKAGLVPTMVIYDGEGHGWAKVQNRVDFWQRVERFLADRLD